MDEINIWISTLSKEDCSPPVWMSLTQPVEGLNRIKRTKGNIASSSCVRAGISLFYSELKLEL